jgi:RNA polymerase sigma-54 factor
VAERVGCDEARVEIMLTALQQFDPAGVFARDLAECLALQLADRDRLDPAMQELLHNLNLVADHDIAGLVTACGVDEEDVRDMLTEIRSLNPKPGLAFDNETAQPIVPDVFIRHAPNGQWHVELNNDSLPRLLVNRSYHARIDGQAKSQADKAYIAEHLNSANWLMKSLDQRANTILKVATELVVQQETFLLYGMEYLRPLNLRNIAQAIEMHESTVSRVTANKYLATSRGIYPMKYFFTSAIPSSGGGPPHSAEAVRHRIRDLIDQEPTHTVLSDDKIVETLYAQGVDIARRTVAKYREAMRIPSSVERRRRKRKFARAS